MMLLCVVCECKFNPEINHNKMLVLIDTKFIVIRIHMDSVAEYSIEVARLLF